MSEAVSLNFDFKDSKQARVPLSTIRENRDSLRPVDRTDPAYQELVESVKKYGVMSPISVREVVDETDGKTYYGLVDGLHRFNASMDAGLDTIPVSIGTLEETQLIAAQILANVQKIDTKPVQYTKALLKLMAAEPTLTRTELAARLAKTPQWLDDRLSLQKLEPSIAKLVDEGKISLTNGVSLTGLPHEVQLELKEKAMTESATVFGTEASNKKKEILKAKREGRPAVEEFVPQERLHRISEIKTEIASLGNGTGELADELRKLEITNPIAAAKFALEWALHLNPIAVAAARAKWENDKKAKDEKKKADALAREEKKLNEMKNPVPV
jgi:ParB family transcriptional regulator, chromosome partitioning protein